MEPNEPDLEGFRCILLGAVFASHIRKGIDFDSPDGLPARLVFLLLTPTHDMSPQIQIMGQIARLFKDEAARQVVYESDTIEMVRAHIKTEMTVLVAH